jgi:hypothetical protein
MPKITFHEFRPGKWVKLVDDKVVGPATAAEVAAWKQEKTAPARIWEDVVATASRPPLGEVKVAKSPAVTSRAPTEQGARKEPDESTLWEDLVKRTKPSVQAEGPPKPRPRQEDTDWAEQAQIWQDVVKRVEKHGRQPAQGAPISPQPVPEVKPELATGASLVPTATLAPAAPPKPAAKPEGEGTSPTKAFAAETTAPKLAGKVPKPTAEAESEEKAALVRKAPDAKHAPRPSPPAKLTVRAAAKPRREPAPVQKALPTGRQAALKAPANKATPQRPASKAAEKGKAAVKGVPAKKTAAPSGFPKPTVRPRLPAKLLNEIAAETSASTAAPAEKAAMPLGRRAVSPSVGRETSGSKPKSSPAAVSRRTTGKTKAASAQERPNPLYLWISAGQADDLIATVRTGLARYQERFSHAAEVVLCHSADLPALEGAKLSVDLREGKSLAPRNFWIGSK